MTKKEYRYREGVHGEHCIDYGIFKWEKIDTIGRAATKQDACQLVGELNTFIGGTNAKLRDRTDPEGGTPGRQL